MKIKRIYEKPDSDDGYRVLVDRLWPRGIRKADAALDEWNKEITPSPELRIWFGHKAERFDAFKKYYLEELRSHEKELLRLHRISENQELTLLYAAKNPKINHAIILLEAIRNTH